MDIEEEILQHYREMFAQEIEDSLFHGHEDFSQETYWFNQGLRYAVMVLRYGSK